MNLESAAERGFIVDTDQIAIGNYAKVCANGERFWVEIVEIAGDLFYGIVANDLICSTIKEDERIIFRKENIFDLSDNDEQMRKRCTRQR